MSPAERKVASEQRNGFRLRVAMWVQIQRQRIAHAVHPDGFPADWTPRTIEEALADEELRRQMEAQNEQWVRLQASRSPAVRCECCGHPMSVGIWERDPRLPHTPPDGRPRSLADAERMLREGREPVELAYVHYSACDERCTHGGPVRARHPREQAWEHWGRELTLPSLPATYAHAEVQASWRPVAARTAGVLCLRCYAERLQP